MSKKLLRHKIFRVRNLFSLLVIISTIIIICSLFSLNVLPNKYNFLISIVLLIIDILGIIFINVHKKNYLKIIGWIILIISFIISVLGTYYVVETNSFINRSFNRVMDVNTTNYYVVALKSNDLSKGDIKGEVSLYKNTYNISKAFNRLDEVFNIKKKEYDDLGLMFTDLLNENSKFILIEASSYEIVFSIDNNLNKDDFSIIYEFSITTKNNNIVSNNTDKFNIFIGGKDFAGLMDFNAVASINMEKHTVILTSIPRDYYLYIPGTTTKDKLSFMSAYGVDTNKTAIEQLFDINIDYSVYINTSSLVDIVDYVGGIEYCSDEEFTTTHALVLNTYIDRGKKLYVRKGCQQVGGIEALTIARERVNITGGDSQRQKNCQKIMLAIFNKLITPKTALHYTETLNELDNIYTTDISKDVFSKFSKDIIDNGRDKWNIITQSVDGLDGKDRVHSSNMIDWVTYPDQATIDNCKKGINDLFN